MVEFYKKNSKLIDLIGLIIYCSLFVGWIYFLSVSKNSEDKIFWSLTIGINLFNICTHLITMNFKD